MLYNNKHFYKEFAVSNPASTVAIGHTVQNEGIAFNTGHTFPGSG